MLSIDLSQWVKLPDLRVLILVDFGKSTYRGMCTGYGIRCPDKTGIQSNMPTTISNLG